MRLGPSGAAGPYAAVARLLDSDGLIRDAQRIADRFPGVDPMDVLRGDALDLQMWLALMRSRDKDIAERIAEAQAARAGR